MQVLTYLAGHVHQLLDTLTIEQGAALVGAACAVGRLLLQGIAVLRATQHKRPAAD